MSNVLTVNKPVGLTPLETIKKIKQKYPHLADTKMTYAGRLDPLAHGVLLLLTGDQTKNRNDYLSLHKTYEFEIVFGLQTDTYDLLGILSDVKLKPPLLNVNIIVNTFVNRHIGKQLQCYPPFSSKPVKGKPLFWWANNNKLAQIEIPKKEIEIFEFRNLAIGELPTSQLKQKAYDSIRSVTGNFRQKEIEQRWNDFFSKNKNYKLLTATFSITCSSGTYVRELVQQLGKAIGCGAVAIDIKRTAVGNHLLKDAITL